MPFKPDTQQPAASGRFRPDPAQRPLDADKDGMQDLPSLPGEQSMKSAPSANPKKGLLESVAAPLGRARDRIMDNPMQIFDAAGAGGEALLSLGTGAVAPFLASARGLIRGVEPDNQDIADVTYQPRNPFSQDIVESIGQALMPISDSGADQALLGLVPETPGAVPQGPRARAPKPAAPMTEGRATAARIREQGIKLTPKEASQITGDKNYFGRALQAIGGESRVSKDIASSNRPVINKMGQKAVGADSLTEQGLKPVKDAGNAVYKEMSSIGSVVPNSQLRGAIERARGSAGKSTKRNLEIDKFVDGVLNEFADGQTVDAGQVVNRVRELRRDAQNARKGEGDKRPTIQQEALGEAQRAVADALDEFLEMNASVAGKPKLAESYKENRVRLAKVGTVEESSRAGNLNAKKVFEAKERGAPLSGKLDEIAVAHEYAPESTSPLGSDTVLEAPGRNLDLLELPVVAAQAAARHMGVRRFLESDFYQNMIGGRAGGPHLAEHDIAPDAIPPGWNRTPVASPPPPPPARPSVNFAGELGIAPDAPFESMPGNVAAPVSGRNLAEALGLQLVEDVQPAGVAPNALRNTPDEINFEAVNPGDVAPYRVNTDLPFRDARPPAGVQRAMDTGDLQLLPDQPQGPFEQMPPKPRGKPRQGGAPREPAKPAPKASAAPVASAEAPEGVSELGALIDEMLRTKRPPATAPAADPAILEALLGDPAMRGDTTPPPKLPPTDPVMARLMEELDVLAAEQEPQAAGARVQNNASGESSASVEAVNRVAAEKAAGQDRFIINPDGTVIPLVGVDAVDASAKPGQVIVQKGVGAEKYTILDRGGLPAASARGRVNAALSSLEGG